MNTRALYAFAALAGYIATIPTANWLVSSIGYVSVGFGCTAPAGIYMVGLALLLRDAVQQFLGVRAVLAAVATGALLSYVLASPALATASATGFLLSELADTLVYTRLLSRGLLGAMLAASVAGIVLDSVLFLGIAFHSEQHLPGQILAKGYMTFAAAAVIVVCRRSARPLAA